MNVSADLLFKMAKAIGAPGDTLADGVVSLALERLQGAKEWWVEVYDEKAELWEFHSIQSSLADARKVAKSLEAQWSGRRYRAVELTRRVLP